MPTHNIGFSCRIEDDAQFKLRKKNYFEPDAGVGFFVHLCFVLSVERAGVMDGEIGSLDRTGNRS